MLNPPNSPPAWTLAEVQELLAAPMNDLLYRAHSVHREHFNPNEIQLSTLLSVKTGGCPEDCHYCPQSLRHASDVASEPLLPLNEVVARAQQAKAAGATRFCMGAAYRGPKERDLARILEYIAAVKALGLETCATLGLLDEDQARRLAEAGLDYYNHNLDTSEAYYPEIITTRRYADRLKTLEHVREAGMRVCCGGIVGLGETVQDRAELLLELSRLNPPPESVPINELVPVPGTPLAHAPKTDPIDFVRVIAVARILMPHAHVRLSAGRSTMSRELQALCFFAGANSIFYGEKLLTTPNNDADQDHALFAALGLRPEAQLRTESRTSVHAG
ncbi:MAG: biotin synthase BioB [Gammaproteobacteria bacterium]